METVVPAAQKVMIVGRAAARFPDRIPSANASPAAKVGQTASTRRVAGVARRHRSRRQSRRRRVLPADGAGARRCVALVPAFYVVIRTDNDPAAAVEPLRRVFRDRRTAALRCSDHERAPGHAGFAQFNTLLLSLLGGVGLVLAATGIYGVTPLRQPADAEMGCAWRSAPQPARRRASCSTRRKTVALGAAIGVIAALPRARC